MEKKIYQFLKTPKKYTAYYAGSTLFIDDFDVFINLNGTYTVYTGGVMYEGVVSDSCKESINKFYIESKGYDRWLSLQKEIKEVTSKIEDSNLYIKIKNKLKSTLKL